MALEHPLYVLVGSESVQRRYLLSRLKQQSGAWERIQAADSDPADLLQPSLLSNHESPLVRVLEGYSSWKPAQRKELAGAAQQLGEGLNVVVCVDRLGAKDPIRSAIPDEAIVSLDSPKRGQFPSWLMRQAKLNGTALDSRAAEEMVSRIGEDTEALYSEMIRLGGLGEISLEQVQRLTPQAAGVQAWGWVDALAGREDGRRQLAECERSGLEPLMMLGALSKRLCLIAWTKLADRESAGASGYPWKLAQEAGRQWEREDLREALLLVAEAEKNLKGQSQLAGYTTLARLGRKLAQSPSSNT